MSVNTNISPDSVNHPSRVNNGESSVKKQSEASTSAKNPNRSRGGKNAGQSNNTNQSKPKTKRRVGAKPDTNKTDLNGSEIVYAYIDGQNLHSGITNDGWKLDYKKFREFLRTEHNVSKGYIFLGFMEEQQLLYNSLQEAGFILVFKPLVRYEDGTVKGNTDADMVLQVMLDVNRYTKAVIISGDGDFAGLIRHLLTVNKLKQVILPNKRTYSSLFERLNEFGDDYFTFMVDLRRKLAYRVGGNQKRSARSNSNSKPQS